MNTNLKPKKQFDYFCDVDGNTICPFSEKKCFKLSRGSIGICALEHKNQKQIICPFAFPKTVIFDLISHKVIKSNCYSVFSEVKLGDNYLDFLLVDDHDKTNYCGIEFQALDTSGNYRWLFGDRVKPFCINWKTTKKTILSQLISKTQIFSNENRKLVLVIQRTFLEYIDFPNLKSTLDGEIIILTFDYRNKEYTNFSFFSIDVDDAVSSFVTEKVCLDGIVNKLTNKL